MNRLIRLELHSSGQKAESEDGDATRGAAPIDEGVEGEDSGEARDAPTRSRKERWCCEWIGGSSTCLEWRQSGIQAFCHNVSNPDEMIICKRGLSVKAVAGIGVLMWIA
jgi:hypothetical protein